MEQFPVCPTCSTKTRLGDDGRLRCVEGHAYTALGLALATNVAAVGALWRAIRALEDDAAGLDWLVSRAEPGSERARRQAAEAAEAREAAGRLRDHAAQAQRRLDSLDVAPSVATDDRAPAQS